MGVLIFDEGSGMTGYEYGILQKAYSSIACVTNSRQFRCSWRFESLHCAKRDDLVSLPCRPNFLYTVLRKQTLFDPTHLHAAPTPCIVVYL